MRATLMAFLVALLFLGGTAVYAKEKNPKDPKPDPTSISVPEPASFALLGTGLLGIMGGGLWLRKRLNLRTKRLN